ncbi:hypothetical protein GCM10010218_10340 [Streptomyces mashuensis]|uniref:histidine kinase n=1 Tax=Streptomyces mashuensis TaxID=33904 RepID=A0A919AYF4_9ACTN|nr:histidine kinase [Streptomyces mashuensis]GHF30943.1 hypothetical protein GCM10010218_10340 [Streptomyces mashuensis]
MKVTSTAREIWQRATAPADWSRRRVVGESVLAALLGLLGGWAETGHGWPRMLLVGLAVAVLTPARRAFPASVLIAAGALTGSTEGGAFLLLSLAGWSAGARIEGVLRALAAYSASFLCFLGLGLGLLSWPEPLLLTAILSTFTFLAFVVVPGLANRYWKQRRTLLQTLQQRNAQLLRERQMIAGQARLRERQRIAQDMHDSLGHQLALIAVQTGALEVDRELTGRQREAVGVLRQASVAAMQELREVVGILRDGTAEEEPPVSRVVAGIDALVESAVAAGMRVRLERSGEARPLAPAADHTAYRVVQEGLTNAAKHAPGAALDVRLQYEPDSLVVEVVNGPPPVRGLLRAESVSGGQGLTGLRERARLVGGMIFSGPAEDGGFRLAGLLPYGSPAEREGRGEGPRGGRTTFVEGEDDFRGQTGGGTPGEGGAVIDRLDPREEFKDIMSPKKSRGCLVGCGVALAVLLALVLAVVVGLGALMKEAEKGTVDPEVYQSATVGEPEHDVRHRLPPGSMLITADVKKKLPANPPGAQCTVLLSSEISGDLSTDLVYRFCFRDGKLIEKREFRVAS